MSTKDELQQVIDSAAAMRAVRNYDDTGNADVLYEQSGEDDREKIDALRRSLDETVLYGGSINKRDVTTLQKMGLDIQLAGDPQDPNQQGVMVRVKVAQGDVEVFRAA